MKKVKGLKSIVEVFKTNVTETNADLILKQLLLNYPAVKFNFDLDDCDRILRAEGQISIKEIIATVTQNGGICEVLE